MITSSFTSAISFAFANLFASTGFIIFLPLISCLIPVILNMTRLFNIGKPVISADNKSGIKTTKDIIWVARVLFPFINKVWQYMLDIPNLAYQL